MKALFIGLNSMEVVQNGMFVCLYMKVSKVSERVSSLDEVFASDRTTVE